MTTILQLDSSASGADSVTNGLNALLVNTIGGDATLVRRDLTDLPSLSNELLVANNTPAADRTPAQNDLGALADSIIDELEAADILVIGAPIYNFGVPGSVKAWMDLIARAGRTFSYGETGPVGHLTGKKAYIVSASGGVPLGSDADFATPHLRTFLGFLGITDVTVIDAGGLMMDPNKIETAQAQIRELATV